MLLDSPYSAVIILGMVFLFIIGVTLLANGLYQPEQKTPEQKTKRPAPVLSIIVAVSENGVIGNNGQMPWGKNIPSDLRRFEHLTKGKPVIMGRKTYESIGEVLVDRKNIIVSEKQLTAPGPDEGKVVDSVCNAIEEAGKGNPDEVFLIGGRSIYELGQAYRADRIYLTRVHAFFQGDVDFPCINRLLSNYSLISKEESWDMDCSKDTYSTTFLIYERYGRRT